MDIAAFVGFAASGPVDVPVAIEDAVRFRDVFGPNLDLARDGATGLADGSQLGPAVEAFFRNGGRRCWVVRVAERATVATARFGVGGLLCLPARAERPLQWRLASLDARSGGGWAGGLRVSALLRSRPLAVRPGLLTDGTVGLAATEDLVPGDLLRITPAGSSSVFLATVSAMTREAPGPVAGWSSAVRVTPAFPTSDEPISAYRLGPEGQTPVVARLDENGLLLPTGEPIAPGDLLRLALPGATVVAQIGAPAAAEPGDPRDVTRFAVAGAWTLDDEPPGDSDRAQLVEQLSLDLLVWREDAIVARLAALGFGSRHPRFWRDLPADEPLFRSLANLPGGPRGGTGVVLEPRLPAPLWAEALLPRFPLAAEAEAAVWLPLGVPSAPRSEEADAPASWRRADGRPAASEPLEREGLARFGAELFVDETLADAGVDRLDTQARDLAFLARPPRALRGIHALYPIAEVSLIAVPDGVHRGWQRTGLERPPALGAPILSVSGHVLSWTPVEGATTYRLEESDEPSFVTPVLRTQGAVLTADAGEDPCAGRRWFRVRALAGPWSNSVSLLDAEGFEACRQTPAPVVLRLVSDSEEDAVELEWSGPVEGAYELELSTAADFRFVDDTVRLTRTRLRLELDRDVTQYVRVRVPDGPWSNTAIVAARPTSVWTLAPPDPDQPTGELLAIQRALLRLCAARDARAFAVLTLPPEAREVDAAAHVAALLPPFARDAEADTGRAGVCPLDAGEAGVLSYGALYHPWVTESGGGEIRVVAPDGAMTGRIAGRTIARGAWIAPANEPLAGSLGLDPERAGVDPAVLAGLALNPLVVDPRGVVPAGGRTLSLDADLEPIGIRRLLTLLRRLVLRDGWPLVFEPNRPQLRDRVVRHLEGVLSELFARGALAGETAAEAYRVRADDTLNPPTQVDNGQLIAEVQVAPSHPMAFITVRLVLDERAPVALVEAP